MQLNALMLQNAGTSPWFVEPDQHADFDIGERLDIHNA